VSRRGHQAGRVVNADSDSVPGRVVVVGASAGGLATAEALRRLGYTGDVILIGNEPHLPYDRPPLSKKILTGELNPDQLALRSPADIDALGLDLRLEETATSLDLLTRTVTLAGGRASATTAWSSPPASGPAGLRAPRGFAASTSCAPSRTPSP
jgi:NADPH-dependent 2,4-dienoyl-CoA reductase/sulfur reductase-like enzyme